MSLADLDNPSSRHAQQIGWLEAEDGIRCPGRRPHFVILQQVLVHKSLERSCVSERRNTADGEPCLMADKLSVGYPDRLAHLFREPELVDAVCPAGDDQDRLSAEFRLEDERFCDLAYYAAYGQCSLSGAASALRQFDNVQREPEPR